MQWSLIVVLGLAVASAGNAWAGAAGTIAGKVDAKKKYRKNTVVYIEKVAGTHKAPSKSVRMDQKGQKFRPFVLPVVTGSTVKFLNSDNTGHNVFSPDGEKYDLGSWNKGESREYSFKKEGVYTQLCKMHPSMIGYIVVLQNPYYAVTKKSGEFEIKNVPPGDYTVKVWNERKKAKPVKVTVKAGETTELNPKIGK
jgi:plastocyanin